jgi:hypothetical protein
MWRLCIEKKFKVCNQIPCQYNETKNLKLIRKSPHHVATMYWKKIPAKVCNQSVAFREIFFNVWQFGHFYFKVWHFCQKASICTLRYMTSLINWRIIKTDIKSNQNKKRMNFHCWSSYSNNYNCFAYILINTRNWIIWLTFL